MIEVKIRDLKVDAKNQFPVVILQSVDGSRALPIWIGPPEASAIALELAGKKFQRPLTHDLLVSILTGVGARVRHVEITDLRENTFFARIILEGPGGVLSVDARPSDSLALALKTKARIFVAPHLFATEMEALLQSEPSADPETTEKERTEALKEFLENLDPRDFGKFSF